MVSLDLSILSKYCQDVFPSLKVPALAADTLEKQAVDNNIFVSAVLPELKVYLYRR